MLKRIISLAALCLFTYIITAALFPGFQKESLPSPEEPESFPARPVGRYFHLIERKGSFSKGPDLSIRVKEAETGSDDGHPEREGAGTDQAVPADVKDKKVPASPPPNQDKVLPGPAPGKEKNCIHFLLIGRCWDEPAAKVLMMVTLVPGQCARITALDPAAKIENENISRPIGELLEQRGGRDRLYPAVTSLTGLTPQFYIDLNLKGFVEMIDLLQKRDRDGSPSREGAVSPSEWPFDGNEMLQLLGNAGAPAEAKEKALVQLLLAACEIQFTPLGLKLLWMGYHNLKTDLSLDDLLEIRKVTQGIAPTDVSLIEAVP